MGNSKLFQHRISEQRNHSFFAIFNHSFFNSLDNLLKDLTEMLESKLAIFILTVIGVPAFIFAWFDKFANWQSDFDIWKTIILAIIAIGLGGLALFRQWIKAINEYREMRKKSLKNQKK